MTYFEDLIMKFRSERKGKLSKYWSYISILPDSYPTVLSGGCSKWLFSCSFILFACWIWKLVKNGPEIMFTNFRNRFKKLIKLILLESELDLIELIKFTIPVQSQSHGFRKIGLWKNSIGKNNRDTCSWKGAIKTRSWKVRNEIGKINVGKFGPNLECSSRSWNVRAEVGKLWLKFESDLWSRKV